MSKKSHPYWAISAESVESGNSTACLKNELNEIVYGLFDLTPEEIGIIEESTKYQYGEV
jgi:hypothetical protein